MSLALDPITGLSLIDPTLVQYQIPLGSQPVNLDELNALGRQLNWMYPDNLPPVVARLQARDLTNEGNAQDLSTDGNRNLNVNIASGGGGASPLSIPYQSLCVADTDPFGNFHALYTTGFKIHSFNYSLALTPGVLNSDRNWWMIFFAFDNNNGSKQHIASDTVYHDAAINVYKPIMQGRVRFDPFFDLLGVLSPDQGGELTFGFQFAGPGGSVSFSGSFQLFYADM